ncbi:GP2 protein [RtMc arterivirus]|uniref:GP2 protein n=1 Tax=RtMc arterivirus TaxID=2847274 RepID=A0A2H4MX20_9NIDO|nr:GP2 protein [Rodent arterivirus]ATP66629.1 GP2 protein [RtMc arterivirus]
MWPQLCIACSPMPLKSFLFLSLIFFFFLGSCSPSQLPGGSSSSWFSLFSLRPAARPVVLDMSSFQKMSDDAVRHCAAAIPPWLSHPLGIAFNGAIVDKMKRLIARLSMANYQGRVAWAEQQLLSPTLLRDLSNKTIVKHFVVMAGLETGLCQYITANMHRVMIAASASLRNMTITKNETTGEWLIHRQQAPIELNHFYKWVTWYRGSIFSAVSAALTLWVVILLRIRRR